MLLHPLVSQSPFPTPGSNPAAMGVSCCLPTRIQGQSESTAAVKGLLSVGICGTEITQQRPQEGPWPELLYLQTHFRHEGELCHLFLLCPGLYHGCFPAQAAQPHCRAGNGQQGMHWPRENWVYVLCSSCPVRGMEDKSIAYPTRKSQGCPGQRFPDPKRIHVTHKSSAPSQSRDSLPLSHPCQMLQHCPLWFSQAPGWEQPRQVW